jgi:hypothetical protein
MASNGIPSDQIETQKLEIKNDPHQYLILILFRNFSLSVVQLLVWSIVRWNPLALLLNFVALESRSFWSMDNISQVNKFSRSPPERSQFQIIKHQHHPDSSTSQVVLSLSSTHVHHGHSWSLQTMSVW